MKRILMMLAVAGLSACNLDTPQIADNPSNPATETFASSLKIDISTMQKTANGAYYKDVSVGTGPALPGVQPVIMTYAGFLKDATLFVSGVQEAVSMAVLPYGLQEAMPGMQSGGERVIVIPSALGYGPAQIGGVPPNSTLVFDIKLDQIP